MWGKDDGIGKDPLAVIRDTRGADPSDLDPLVEDGGVVGQTRLLRGSEFEAEAFCRGCEYGGSAHAVEAAGRRADGTVPGAFDINAGENRIEAGDACGRDLWAHDPERGVGVDKGRDLLIEADVDIDAVERLRERDVFHHTDRDIAEPQVSLVGGNACGIRKGNADQGAALHPCVPRHPEGDQKRADWDDPDDRGALEEALAGAFDRDVRGGTGHAAVLVLGRCLSQIIRESKACADSIVNITESAKVRAAGPGAIVTMMLS